MLIFEVEFDMNTEQATHILLKSKNISETEQPNKLKAYIF